jgi:hypothetical protein
MYLRHFALFAACLALISCWHSTHLMKMEDELTNYGEALRWGLYQKAGDFRSPLKRTRIDLGQLKNIHVTSYTPIYRDEPNGSSTIYKQTVDIHFYDESTGIERSLTDNQTWRYDKDRDHWFLETGLPKF